MITVVNEANQKMYKDLFEEASAILNGYKRVKTYDNDISEYYYRIDEWVTLDDGSETNMILDTEITDLRSFANSLSKYVYLYVKTGKPAENFDPKLGITTLEEYFSWLKTLANLTSGEDENIDYFGRKYTVLPLDEPHFVINTNTRAINIPSDFKKNGIAVQGDDLAEIVYFEVDRYFDYMDLNNCEIYIQWETPPDANKQTKKSVSRAYVRDIESQPGKLIFGWAISDAITHASGNLKFSVRFFEWQDPNTAEAGGEKVIAYSLSTLTAQVSIQSSIGFNPETDEYEIDDVGERLVSRLEDSVVVGGYVAATPEFVKNLDNDNPWSNVANLADAFIYDLELNEDGTAGTFDLLVQAKASDTGVITYTWKRQELNEDNTVGQTDLLPLNSRNYYEPIDLIEDQADLDNLDLTFNYYKLIDEENQLYTLYTDFSLEDIPENGLQLYVKNSGAQITSAGVYYVTAENRISNSATSKNSFKAIFPRPEDVIFSAQPEKHFLLEDIDGDGIYDNALSVEIGNTDGSTQTYQWLWDSNAESNFGEEQANFVEAPGDNSNQEYAPQAEGHYKVIVTNHRNLEEISKTSEFSRVTRPATRPEIQELSEAERRFYASALSDENCPTIYLNPDIVSDYYSVTWWMSLNEGSSRQAITEEIDLQPGVCVAKFNPLNYQEKIFELTQDDDVEGAYYPIVTNHRNGSSAQTYPWDNTYMFVVTQ